MSGDRVTFDFRKFFERDFFMLKFLGIYYLTENAKIGQILYSFIVSLPLMVVATMVQIINMFCVEADLRKMAASGYLGASCLMAVIKELFLFKNKKFLLNIQNDMNRSEFQPKDAEGVELVERCLSGYKKTRKVVLIVCSIAVSGCLTMPFLSSTQLLPLSAWYPFDVTYSPVYELIYIHQSVSLIYLAYMNIYIDILVSGFTTFVSLQCALLCHKMESQRNINSVKEFVIHHKWILNFVFNIEKLITEMYFLQFSACTVIFCLSWFLLTMIDVNSFEFVYLFAYQTAIGSLLLIPCWYSSEMERQSQLIPFSVYSLPWRTNTHQFKKDVYFFLLGVQKPIFINIVGLFPLSVDTFTKILRSSFSYYTVLNNMNLKSQANN
ncbi:unnamed protein product [Phyllotreta striolata]|uniref:Odorant receptor n=1 Tax=Phyllotreta striolata TaxID=444603 RepID=A0A9N9TF68_PHYSR|nr:unnamed protein product [Phyllotreta striolata]